jgi:hypothetical protein
LEYEKRCGERTRICRRLSHLPHAGDGNIEGPRQHSHDGESADFATAKETKAGNTGIKELTGPQAHESLRSK